MRRRPGSSEVPCRAHRHAARFAVLAYALATTLALLALRGPAVTLAWAEEDALPDPPVTNDVHLEVDLGGENYLNPQQTPDSSFIYDTSIEELAAADPYMDGQTVQVRGEVVGDRINAEFDPGHCWITLQSLAASDSTVSVYMSKSLSDSIDTYGAYGKVGTTLQVRGTFDLACVEHDGLSDLHADQVSVVKKGHAVELEADPAALALGTVLVVAGLVLAFIFWRIRESRR